MNLECTSRINMLKQGIEQITGENYTNLTEGVQALKNNYGQGKIDWNKFLNDFGSNNITEPIKLHYTASNFRNINAFYNCNLLEEVIIDNVDIIPASCFEECTNLKKVTINNVNLIGDCAFQSCSSLMVVIINASTVPTFYGDAVFCSTPIEEWGGGIYVPDELVDSYYEVTNIAHFPIYPISALPEVI